MADNEGFPQTADGAAETAVASTPAAQQSGGTAAGQSGGTPAPTTDLSVAELREWLRRWVADATGQPIEQITVDRPMEEFGLASRDALALGGDIEELTGVTLNATIVYQHPTIASLAERIVNGEPDVPEGPLDEAFYTAAHLAGDAHDVAIVGLSTRLPGAGDTPESTWEFLAARGDGIRERPPGRWSEFTSDPRLAAAIDAANTKGGYLDQDVIKGFDAEFFAMSPLEVERVDPQQRLMMELTWEALEHARIPANELKGEPVGVFIGSSTNDFMLIAALGLSAERDPNVPVSAEAYSLMGSASSIIPNRVSYFYDFRGPSVSVDTACSSTLVAVHQAVRALRSGEADVALAGGVNMLVAPAATLGFEANGAIAKDGHVKAFSADADGFVRSEGGGLVVLKRLADAERDGDQIYAVIKGSAVNNDGRSNGLLAPNPDAQAEVLRRAYRDAGIAPTSVDYVEAHGTGTLLGDPIEADALARVIGRGRDADKPVLLGSAKTNFGHLESAAGAASLAKVVMALQHNVIPPSVNYAGPNPYIPFDQARLRVVDEPTEFPRYSGTATIGVSGFGFGGTNAHLVIQEYVPAAEPTGEEFAVPAGLAAKAELEGDVEDEFDDETTEVIADAEAIVAQADAAPAANEPEWTAARATPLPVILPVSGYLPSRRRRAATDLADWLESAEGASTPLADVARTLAKRNHGRSRGVVLATTHEEAIAGLRAVAAGKPGPGVFTADAPAAHGPMWVLAGFGAQHRKMGKQLYHENSIFARTVDKVDELMEFETGYSVREMILDDEQDWDVGTSQVGIFTIQVALAEVLRAHGAAPEAVVGHSMGEAAGAYIAGGLNLEDAVRVISARSRLMGEAEQALTDDQVRNMALVEYSADAIVEVLADYPDLEVAVYAAPTNTVIGGPPEQVHAVVARAESEGKFARVLPTRGAGHTSQMDPLLGELSAELAGIEPTPLRVDLYSTVHRDAVYPTGNPAVHDVDYWVTNMRHSVYFTNAVRHAVDNGITTYLELAPNSVALMQVLGTTYAAGVHNAALIPTLKRKEDESAAVVAALAQLYAQGHPVDLSSLLPAGPFANAPRTAFLRKEYWPKANIAVGGSGTGRVPGSHVALPDGRHAWEVSADVVTDLGALVTAAAAQVLADVALGASVARAAVPASGLLTTTLTPHPGGASVQVHAAGSDGFRLLFDAVVSSGAPLPVTAVAPAETPAPRETAAVQEDSADTGASFGERWSPDSTETIDARLRGIVAETMGYAPEDLPMEIPLMELGLDSLMAMRIKNRVEYEFDIPQLQIAAVRDASLDEVAKMLRYAIEHRDEVEALAAGGGTLTVDETVVAAARAAIESGADPAAAAKAAAGVGTATQASGSETVDGTGTGPSESGVIDGTATAAAGLGVAAESATAPADSETSGETATAAAESGVRTEAGREENVPPRDAAERLTYATWATVTGKSAGGIFNLLPAIDGELAGKLSERLSERVGATVDPAEVRAVRTIEQLSDIVRRHQEDGGSLDGFVRTLRARPDGAATVPVFVFHPSGGNTLVYEPLLKRLPADTPMYGFERVEGSIDERARQYIPEIRKLQPEGPYVLYGWSLGAVFALQVAQIMRSEGADVRLVGLIDLALPVDNEVDTPEERVRRIERYQAFAKKTYGFNGELDQEQMEELAGVDDAEQFQIISELIKFAGVQIPGGVLEHQRTSWVESRELQKVTPSRYDGDTVLYLADRYHDGIIELEPRFADRRPNGGWDEYIPNLEIIHIPGDHLQIVDEPRIATIGADLTAKLTEIQRS
ncbi:polyketide synthase Pks13 [Nocardia aurantia]|uniref:Polyketide synthase n=1 Tax=Nocardia aurantia TaxID=2585199 RepID=A0A7K0DMC8_9NOCA|nr:polyketide synthase Pks13 [Nocardia aurantia]MQY26906.1 hypothetical protein [Nocardia aurantia]